MPSAMRGAFAGVSAIANVRSLPPVLPIESVLEPEAPGASVKLSDAAEAYKTFRDKKDGCIKVILLP